MADEIQDIDLGNGLMLRQLPEGSYTYSKAIPTEVTDDLTTDPFARAALRVRQSVKGRQQLPVEPETSYKAPSYIMEPDLLEAQGIQHLPTGIAYNEAGIPFNIQTGAEIPTVPRPNVLPVAKTPEGYTFAMPKMLDVAGNIMGGVAGAPVKAGEALLGSGPVRKVNEQLINKAKEHFGITREPKEAGYVLPDGSMLDLSGRHYAVGYENINGRFVPKTGQPDYLKGTRSVDHREVVDITDVGGTEGMRQFMNETGAIRNQPGNGIDTTVIPTDQQLNRLVSSHNSSYKGEPFTVDISHPVTGENIASKTFEKPNVEKIKKWIANETAKHPTLYSDTRNQVYAAAGHELEKQNQPFFSALSQAVDNAKIGKASADQWLGYLKNQPGVKSEEINTVLGGMEGNLTKQQVQDIVKQNGVKLGEVVKGGILNRDEMIEDQLKRWPSMTRDEAIKAVDKQIQRDGLKQSTKYHDYQLSGGENYKEMLLTLPDRTPTYKLEDLKEAPKTQQPDKNIWYIDAPDNTFIIPKSKASTLEEAKQYIVNNKKPNLAELTTFKSSHWDEPNIIAHVRMNDRMVDGKKTLHLEEIQSDWGQSIRKSGYKLDAKEKEILETTAKSVDDRLIAANREDIMGNPDLKAGLGQAVKDKLITQKEADDYLKLTENERSTTPNMPFKKNWDELALKRMLHKAATEGYEGISWTPGEAQAARYDLSKHIDNVEYGGSAKAGDNWLTARDKNNNIVMQKRVDEKDLADHIGKEAAEKLIKQEPKNGFKNLENADLKIGGEGMKSFYDKMLVDKANALAKKYGSKVEQRFVNADKNEKLGKGSVTERAIGGYRVEYPNGHAEVFAEKSEAQNALANWKSDKNQPIHYLPITPELRAKAKQGFPLFSSTPILNPVSFDPFNRNDKKYKLTPIQGNPFQ